MNRQLTFNDLYIGVDRNILCYDSEAKPGIITNRLIDIMKRTYIENTENDQLYTIY